MIMITVMIFCVLLQELVTIFFAYNAVQVVLSFSIFVGAQWACCTWMSAVVAAYRHHPKQRKLFMFTCRSYIDTVHAAGADTATDVGIRYAQKTVALKCDMFVEYS